MFSAAQVRQTARFARFSAGRRCKTSRFAMFSGSHIHQTSRFAMLSAARLVKHARFAGFPAVAGCALGAPGGPRRPACRLPLQGWPGLRGQLRGLSARARADSSRNAMFSAAQIRQTTFFARFSASSWCKTLRCALFSGSLLPASHHRHTLRCAGAFAAVPSGAVRSYFSRLTCMQVKTRAINISFVACRIRFHVAPHWYKL